MTAELQIIAVAIALLSPVYGLLWTIQRRLGKLAANQSNVRRRVSRIEKVMEED